MSSDPDEPLIRIEHLIDALIVGVIVFCSVLLGDVVVALSAGQPAYVPPAELIARSPTGAVAFLLTFMAQWARARGIELKALLLGGVVPSDNSDEDSES